MSDDKCRDEPAELQGKELVESLRRKLDDLRFQLQEYERAVRLPVKAVAFAPASDGNGPAITILIDGAEPLSVQPGMVMLVMLPKEK